MRKHGGMIVLCCAVVLAVVAFVLLYRQQQVVIEKPEKEAKTLELAQWCVAESEANGASLTEDKSIYDGSDNSIYDVYLSVFPTKDESGKMIDFSAFGKHVARDHTYNPTLNCNVQIVEEDGKLDPLINLDEKNATIRVRGNSSRGDTYKSYKVKLSKEAGEFQGQTILNLNKHSEDYSKITTKFCTDILQGMEDMVSYRTNFMRVWIRDTSLPKAEQEFKYYGLFTHIEQPNKKFLEVRGLSSGCEMYKARDFSFQRREELRDVKDPEYSKDEFETVLGIREGDSHKKLLDMLDAVNDQTSSFEPIFQTYFNEDNYLTWLAFNILVGGEDILNHNFLLYSPNNSMTWYFIPWDFDSNLEVGESVLPMSLRGGQKLNQVILHRRFFRIPGNLEKLKKRMEELMQNDFCEERVQQLTKGYFPVLEKTMTLEPDIDLLRKDMTPADLIPFIQSYPQMIEQKYQEFLQAFEYPAPMFVSLPEKNPDGTLHLAWDNSYSYQGRTIVYHVQIAKDCHMREVIYEARDLIENSVDTTICFEPGTYYLKVTAEDSAGNEQISLEHYEFRGERFIYENGVLEFTVE